MGENCFSFLKDEFSDIYNICSEMEENIINNNYDTSLILARKAAELTVNQIYIFEKLDFEKDKNQYTRLSTLKRKKIINYHVFNGYHNIRVSGNDANHKNNSVSQEDVIHIHSLLYEITKDFYKKYSTENKKINKYSGVNFNKLRISEELLKEALEKLQKNNNVNISNTVIEKTEDNKESSDIVSKETKLILDKKSKTDLKIKNSHLLYELSRLKDSSQEAVEGYTNLSDFKKYIHVSRNIQEELIKKLESVSDKDSCHLILLCGNVGDGKSHMLAYLNENYKDLMKNFNCLNDATESIDPDKSSLYTLSRKLSSFNDSNIDTSKEKLIVSINLGVLNNFIESDIIKTEYSKLISILNELNIFDINDLSNNYDKDPVSIISFSDYNLFEFDDNTHELKSDYISEIFSKITSSDEKNPFYLAYLTDIKDEVNSPILYNYELFRDKNVQDIIIINLIKISIKYKKIISTRELLNFIYEILVPPKVEVYSKNTSRLRYINQLLPNLLFQSTDRCDILKILHNEDPILKRSSVTDRMLMELNVSSDIKTTLLNYMNTENILSLLDEISREYDLHKREKSLISTSLIRFLNIFGKTNIREIFTKTSYIDYVNYLYYYNKEDKKSLKELINDVVSAIFKWKGRVDNDYLCVENLNKFKIGEKMNIKFSSLGLKIDDNRDSNRFKNSIQLNFKVNNSSEIKLNLDYQLYDMIMKLNKGYKPNKKEQKDLLLFNEFIDRLIDSTHVEEYLIYYNKEDISFNFKLDEFDQYTFKRV